MTTSRTDTTAALFAHGEQKTRNHSTRRTEPDPVVQSRLAALPFLTLREYRETADRELESVKYWRRVVKQRRKILRRVTPPAAPAVSRDELMHSIGSTVTGEIREWLYRAEQMDPPPGFPTVEDPWAADLEPEDFDTERLHAFRLHLDTVEAAIVTYSDWVDVRLTTSTSELFRRYSNDPNLVVRLVEERFFTGLE